jgi:hypothetical protein
LYRSDFSDRSSVWFRAAAPIVYAPTDEGQSKWVIDAAKAKYPEKPSNALILAVTRGQKRALRDRLCACRGRLRQAKQGPPNYFPAQK